MMMNRRLPSSKQHQQQPWSVLAVVMLAAITCMASKTTTFLLLMGKVEAVLPHYAMDIVTTTTATDSSSHNAAAAAAAAAGKTYTKISTMLLSHAYFGGTLPMKNSRTTTTTTTTSTPEQQKLLQLQQPLRISYPPDEMNALLCQNNISYSMSENDNDDVTVHNNNKSPPFVMLVPRGECTFETKAYHAQLLGATAVIIYGNLASRYTYNNTTNTTSVVTTTTTTTASSSSSTSTTNNNNFFNPNIIYPQNKYDYDCSYGKAYIPKSQTHGLTLNPIYNPYINDPLLSSTTETNLCRLYDYADGSSDTIPKSQQFPSFRTHCASQQCLLTGNNNDDDTDDYIEACCAWDLHIWLYPDHYSSSANIMDTNYSVTIPVAYMTTQQVLDLKQIILQNTIDWNPSTTTTTPEIGIILYQRWRPTYNYSALCIWLLGCVIATIASYYSANEYHTVTQYYYNKRIRNRLHRESQATTTTTTTTTNTAVTSPEATTTNTTSSSSLSQHPPPQLRPSQPEEVLELTAIHAVAFVIMASTSLMVLFYFKIYSLVKIMYAFGCSTAVAQVIFVPLYDSIITPYYRNIIVYRTNTEDFGDITMKDIVTFVCGFSCGISWLIISFLYHNAEEIVYYWVMQDVFGACMCITFLKVIRLNSIRVASILLIVAFFYDIFFVFITPHLFHGKSVMITVATSGGPPKADALWCEKYPSDKDCQGGNPLPMLLAIPKLFDYTGGSSLLGLGDIVLPGLLLSFAARYDAAKILVGVMGGGRPTNQSYSCPEQQCFNSMLPSRCGTMLCSGGYFGPLIVAYAIGLAMANTAVYVMHMGQPALLYLVPCCLGTMIYIGYRRNELTQLWDGPRVLQTADNILYNNNNNGNESGTGGNGQEPQSTTSNSSSGSNNNKNLHAPIPMDDEGYGNDALAVAPPSAVDDDDDDNIN